MMLGDCSSKGVSKKLNSSIDNRFKILKTSSSLVILFFETLSPCSELNCSQM